MPQVSIIVPIYNGEKYLNRCIDSILLQTLEDFELVLVNDGSNDGSLPICDEYAAKDMRIKVINQANSGVSMARNNGVDTAKGDYICFIDCDDWVDPCYLQLLYNNLKESSADLSMTGYREITEAGELGKDTSTIGYTSVLDADQAMFHLFEAVDFMSFCYPWGKLFKTDIIRRHNIRFNPSIAIGEDRLFIFDYLHHAGKVSCTSKATYNYLQNGSGAMASFNAGKVDLRILSLFSSFCIMREKLMKKDILLVLNSDFVRMLIRTKVLVETKTANKEILKRIRCFANYYIINPQSISKRLWLKLFLSFKLGIKVNS